ncbi:MMS19 nucleotide excision repair protein isoform X2 [Haemaphysalis longicornis]
MEVSSAMDASVLYESDDKFQEKVSYFANVIKADGGLLLEMLESMGHCLTHEKHEERVAGVKFITAVIQALPPKTLQTKQTTALLRFYVCKLDDHPSMAPFVVRSLYELVVNHEPAEDDAIESLLNAMLYGVGMPGLVQSERYMIYRMLAHLLINSTPALRRMGTSPFVLGCIQAIEGERDPRCLLQVFSIIPMMCSKFHLDSSLLEPLFEVCACYFPVDFNPPRREVGQIAREELSEGLLNCLTAAPGLGKFCVPLVVEKLGSDLVQAKSDALEVLIRGAEVFPPGCFADKAILIWKQIHNLVFVNRHEAIIPSALKCLTSVAKVISRHPKQASLLTALFKVVWKDLQEGAAPGMGQVLEALAKASAEACSTVLMEALPSILKLLSAKNDGLRQVLVLETTTRVLSIFVSLCTHPDPSANPVDAPMEEESSLPVTGSSPHCGCQFVDALPFAPLVVVPEASQELKLQLGMLADELCELLTSSNHELSLRAAAAASVALPIHGFFTEGHLDCIMGLLREMATREDGPPVRDEHVSLLAAACRTSGTVADIFEMLQSEMQKGYHPGKTERLLALAAGCTGSPLNLLKMVPYVMERFVCAIRCMEIEHRNLLARCVCEISRRSEEYGTGLSNDAVLKAVTEAWIEAAMEGHKVEHLESFAAMAQLVQRLVQVCSAGTTRDTILHVEEYCRRTTFASCPLLFLQCLVCHARPQSLSSTQPSVESIANACTGVPSQVVAWCLAGYVNKVESGVLERILESLQPSFQPEWTLAKTDMVLWVTKGLLLRGYSNLAPYTKLLEELLKDEKVGRRAAAGFQEILQPSVLTVEGHCTVQLMYQQRFFVETVDFLIEGFNSATIKAVKDNFLMALCGQLAYVPKPVVSSYIDKVLPILVSALSSAEESVIGDSVLPCLTENVSLMVSCLDSVLGQLLRLARPPSPLGVRQSALQCLLGLSSVEQKELLPYRQQVLRGLAECTADHKRLVRQAAAQASLAWHLIGEPVGV